MKYIIKVISQFLFLAIIIFALSLSLFWLQKSYHQYVYEQIKEAYSPYVVTNHLTFLYGKKDNQYYLVGLINKDIELALEETTINDYHDAFFKVKDQDYYIKYTGVKKIDKIDTYSYPYLDYGLTITTNYYYQLYRDEALAYSLIGSNTYEVLINDTNYYGILYNNELVKIAKQDVAKAESYETYSGTKRLSIIYFNSSSDGNYTKAIAYLKANRFEAISLADYQLWNDNKIKLKSDSIVVVVKDDSNQLINNNDYLINLDDGQYTFNFNNKAGKRGEVTFSTYQMSDKITTSLFKNIAYGADLDADQTSIAVINYHFFYDETKTTCSDWLCLKASSFKEELDYLVNNGFTILTMQQFVDWLDGDFEAPAKSVLLTIDDGALGTSNTNGNVLIPILEEYKVPATLFLITSWWYKDAYQSPYLLIQSHGYDIHKKGLCNKSKLNCLNYDTLLTDLVTSKTYIDTPALAFAYPFYSSNDNALMAVRDAGFSVAFTGGERKAKRSDIRYLIPRFEITRKTTLANFIKIVN